MDRQNNSEIMDELSDHLDSRVERSKTYLDRFNSAEKGIGFHNCAGLVKYLIGLADKDGFIRTGDASENGLIAYLSQQSMFPIHEFTEDLWNQYSEHADVVAFLKNMNDRWQYMHFVVPNPDPRKAFEVFHRNGFEESEAQISDIRTLLSDPEYAENTSLVFMKKK